VNQVLADDDDCPDGYPLGFQLTALIWCPSLVSERIATRRGEQAG
jgi:hypothetical protein